MEINIKISIKEDNEGKYCASINTIDHRDRIYSTATNYNDSFLNCIRECIKVVIHHIIKFAYIIEDDIDKNNEEKRLIEWAEESELL